MSLGERLKRLRGHESRKSLADKLGIDQATIVNYENGKRLPNSEFIARLCRLYNVTTDWLIYGSTLKELHQTPLSSEGERRVQIPLKGTELSAGGGSFIDSVETIRMISVDPEMIKYKGNLNDLIFMKVNGDSMEPGIYNGDLVLVNLARRDVFFNRVYALTYEGVVYVKRLIPDPGRYILRSNNPGYPDKIIDTKDPAEMSQFYIIGQVAWWIHCEHGEIKDIPLLNPSAF